MFEAPSTPAAAPEASPDSTIAIPVEVREAPIVRRVRELYEKLDALAAETEGSYFHTKIAGVTKRNSDGTSRQKLIDSDVQVGDELDLFPEPTNRYDKNAIAVEALHGQIGYLPQHIAAQVKPDMDRGYAFRCFVTELTGWEHGRWGVNIALLRWNRLQKAFEAMLDQNVADGGGEWFIAALRGLTKLNDDGRPRQELIATLKPSQGLGISCAKDFNRKRRVQLTCEEGVICEIDKLQSDRVLETMEAGDRWAVVVRDVHPTKGGKLVPRVALIQYTKAWVDAHPEKLTQRGFE